MKRRKGKVSKHTIPLSTNKKERKYREEGNEPLVHDKIGLAMNLEAREREYVRRERGGSVYGSIIPQDIEDV